VGVSFVSGSGSTSTPFGRTRQPREDRPRFFSTSTLRQPAFFALTALDAWLIAPEGRLDPQSTGLPTTRSTPSRTDRTETIDVEGFSMRRFELSPEIHARPR